MAYQDESTRHLVELGYVDPQEVAAEAVLRRQRGQAQLQDAVDLHRQGATQQAIELLEQLSVDDPDWRSPHHLLADIYYQSGRSGDTQAQIDWLTEHAAESPRLSMLAAALALYRRDLKAALASLEYACHVEPDLANGQMLLGKARLRFGKLEEAEIAFQSALKRNRSDANALEGLAAICLKRGMVEEAADWALQALAQDMSLTRSHFYLSLALTHLGRSAEALQAMETCVKTQPALAAPYRWLAWIAEAHLGDPAQAAKYRELGREVVRARRLQSPRE